MKRKFFAVFLITCIAMCNTSTAFAAETADVPSLYSIEFEDSTLDQCVLLSKNTYEENGRLITVTEYRTPSGDIITDTFDRSSISTFSKNGTDTATRTRSMGDYGKITVTASFRWYTDASAGVVGVSYVKCTGMSSSHTNVHPNIVTSKWNESYTSEYQSFGVARAGVSYYMYNRLNPAAYQSGSVTITCDDTGAISDNIP